MQQTPGLYELFSIIQLAQKTLKNALASDEQFPKDPLTQSLIEEVLSQKKLSFLHSFPTEPSNAQIMRCVDLTILDVHATEQAVKDVARRAAQEHCATVCVYPQHIPWVRDVMQELNVTDVPPIAVVGFPMVASPSILSTQKTIDETLDAIAKGAKEIDMVLPFCFKSDSAPYFSHFQYLKSVIDVAHTHQTPVKVILETAYLSDLQIALASMISKVAGADWVKTSTGFAQPEHFAPSRSLEEKGATPRAVALMRLAVGHFSKNPQLTPKPMGVKASGGVRNKEQALSVLYAGADRIGASSGIVLDTPAQTINTSY